jgi:peptidoglycan DL-endopeptidase CwlO
MLRSCSSFSLDSEVSLVSRLRSRLPAMPLVLAALVATTIAPAAADPIHVEDQLDRSALQQAERDSRELENVRVRLQTRLDEIEQEVSGAVEAYNVAVEELELVEAERLETIAELEQLNAELDALSRLAGTHVRRLHKMGGPGLELATMLASANPTDAGARTAALRRVLDAQLIDLETLGAARTAVSAAEARLAELEAQAAERAAEVEAALEALQDKLAEHQDEMADIEVRLRAARHRVAHEEELLEEQRQELIAREEARRAEEERARQEAEERARQQAAAEAEARRRAQAEADARERAQAQQPSQPTATATSTTSAQSAQRQRRRLRRRQRRRPAAPRRSRSARRSPRSASPTSGARPDRTASTAPG